jgi:regulatory protein YycH of two-component signal transduction system YycFG
MEFVIVLAVLVVVALVVLWPLLRGSPDAAEDGQSDSVASPEIAELEAAREAKYREIRDAELDHRTGKLSDADYEAVDGALRAEASEILKALDRATGR